MDHVMCSMGGDIGVNGGSSPPASIFPLFCSFQPLLNFGPSFILLLTQDFHYYLCVYRNLIFCSKRSHSMYTHPSAYGNLSIQQILYSIASTADAVVELPVTLRLYRLKGNVKWKDLLNQSNFTLGIGCQVHDDRVIVSSCLDSICLNFKTQCLWKNKHTRDF